MDLQQDLPPPKSWGRVQEHLGRLVLPTLQARALPERVTAQLRHPRRQRARASEPPVVPQARQVGPQEGQQGQLEQLEQLEGQRPQLGQQPPQGQLEQQPQQEQQPLPEQQEQQPPQGLQEQQAQ